MSSDPGAPDVARPTSPTTSGPMTRARVKALHDKVNSLLSMCDLDTPLNGLLLHSDTLCILRHEPLEDLQGSVEVGQGSSQEDEGEGEKIGKKSQAVVLPPVAAVLPPRVISGAQNARGTGLPAVPGRYYRWTENCRKHPNENDDILSIRTPFSMIFGSLES